MSRARWFRDDNELVAFDWLRAARELDIPEDVARALYIRALRVTSDMQHAEVLYHRWLRDAAEARRSRAVASVPGRRTRILHELEHAGRQPDIEKLAPGRWTRVLLKTTDESGSQEDELQRALDALSPDVRQDDTTSREHVPAPRSTLSLAAFDCRSGVATLRARLVDEATDGQTSAATLAAADPAIAAEALQDLATHHLPGHTAPVLRLITQSADGEVERVLARRSAGAALPGDVAARLGPHVGAPAAAAARLHTDDTADLIADAHHAHAVTLGSNIYFARGAYAPGTERGDELLAHELTHVAQGQRGELARAAAKGIDSGCPLDPAEVEADLRARFAAIQLQIPEQVVPVLAEPSGQPASDADRVARLEAQQQRIHDAEEVSAALAAPPAPATATPLAPEQHPVPEIAAPPDSTSTGNAYIDTFDAAPSLQATELWAGADELATTQVAEDQATFDAALPEMPIVLEGAEPPVAAEAGDATVAATPAPDAGTAPPPVEPTPTPIPEVPPPPATAIPEQTSTDQAAAQTSVQQAIEALPTTAPDVNTSPGTAPVTELAGQTDPLRATADHQHAITDGARAFDSAMTAIISGPGPAQVQPVRLDETLEVPDAQPAPAMPALPTVEGMVKFQSWNLPVDAQASFDAVARPRMEANLAEAKAQMTAAETTRNAERTLAVTDAQARVQQAHADADRQQQARVAEARTQIANHQATTLLQHEAEVRNLDQQARDRKASTLTTINDRITADQATVETDFQDAQLRADERRVQGEAEAAQKKEDAQAQTSNQSWWDQLVGSINDAIQSIADDINQVLADIGTAIGQIIDDVKNAACQLIEATRSFVCDTLTAFGDWLTSAVDSLIGTVFPELAAALNTLINDAVTTATTAVNQLAADLTVAVTEACDGLKASIDAAIATFQAAVDAAAALANALATGDWEAVARLVLDGILTTLGIDPAAFYTLIGTAEDALQKIIEDPGAFVGHLIDAVVLGFQQFGDNFLTYLSDGLVEWLVGTLGEAGIQMPASLDLAGIFDLVCQVLGLTWPRLRERVVEFIGEENTERLEAVADYIQAFLTGGFVGLWEQVQQDLSNLWDTVVGGIQDWLIQNVVQAAILRLATMWNPIGALINLIQTAWSTYQWLRENAERIFGLVEAIVTSISNIANGDITGAANFIETSLARLVPIAISLFANLLGLGGIAGEIQRIIGDIQTAVDQAIDALIERVMAMFRGGNDNGEHPDGDATEEAVEHFSDTDGSQHELTVAVTDGVPEITVASANEVGVWHQIDRRRQAQPAPNETQTAALRRAEDAHNELLRESRQLSPSTNIQTALQSRMTQLAAEMVAGDAWAATDDVVTHVEFSSSGTTKQATADPLTKRPGNTIGSPAQDVLPNWQHEVGPQTSGAEGNLRWRRVHLLADRLHGPGNNPENLVPGDARTNEALQRIENDAFQRIVAGEQLRYVVTATLDGTRPYFPVGGFGISVSVAKLDPGTKQFIDVPTEPIPTATVPTKGQFQLSGAQQAIIAIYIALHKSLKRSPSMREVGNAMDPPKTKQTVHEIVVQIRELISQPPENPDEEARTLLEEVKPALNLPLEADRQDPA